MTGALVPLGAAAPSLGAPALTTTWVAVPVLVGVVVAGIAAVGVLDRLIGAVVAGDGVDARVVTGPATRAARWWRTPPTATERPDHLLWHLAPALYVGVAVLGLSVVPLAQGFAVADVRTGIVVFGAAEVITIVAVYLHGWSANAPLSLVGGYRFMALGLSFMLLSMFALIGAALPAESLAVGEIVASQRDRWHVVSQPLGLPLLLVAGLGAAFWGPFDQPDAADLSGGTAAEVTGRQLLSWEVGRRCVLVTYAVASAAVFLGGWHGPLLPGWLWMALKSLAVLVVLVGARHVVGRVRPESAMTLLWLVGLPLAFLDLAIAGIVTFVDRGIL